MNTRSSDRLLGTISLHLGMAVVLFLGALLACGLPVVQAATYEVGPGKTYTNISDVALESLSAGDTVKIYYRTTPYKEKWVICAQGTQSNPVTFEGVPGTGGELPIIDGDDATTRTQLSFWSETRCVIKFGESSTPSGTPTYIVLENLDIKSARAAYDFTDDGGSPQTYSDNASAVWVVTGQNITFRNCTFRDSGNGFFTYSTDSAATQDILVEGCYIYDNGNTDSIYEHNNYTESQGIIFQYNHFGPLRTGCSGNNLKDRSAGQVVRYNWIESGNRQLDLVDAEDSSIIRNDADYDETWVYGNILVEGMSGNRQICHYGGDSGSTRGGTLYFYNNTVVSTRTDQNTLFRISSSAEDVDARNNIIYTTLGGSYLEITSDDSDGSAVLRNNWIKSGYSSGGASVTSYNTVSTSSPGFVNESNQDYHLTSGSDCVDAGTTLHSNALPVSYQYVKHQDYESRPSDSTLDIGAYEYDGGTPADLEITTTSLPAGTVDVAYSQTVQATGGTTPYSWSVVSGSLPAGLSLGSSTGTISGTPTTANTYNFTVQVTDSQGTPDSDTQALSITIAPENLVITTSSLPAGTVDVAYSQTVQATGGTTPYSWSIVSGSLPAGLSLGSSTGTISGTPTTANTYNFTVRVTDDQGTPDTDDQALSITINAGVADLVITTSSLPGGTVSAAYSQTVQATGGTTPYSWSIVSGSLPAGLSLGSSTGTISGTPTTANTYNFTVRVTDSQGTPDTDDQALSITIAPANLVITTSSLPGGTVDVAYSQTVQATGGTTPYSWSIVSGSLPAGLSLGSSTGAISGTPTTANTYNFTVRVTDSQGTPDTDDQALSITISAGGPVETTYQQGLDSYTGWQDTWITEDDPTTNFATVLSAHLQYLTQDRQLHKFDISDIPSGATINSATLSIYAYQVTDEVEKVQVYRVITPWVVNQATYNIASTGTSWGTAGLESGTDYDGTVIDTSATITGAMWADLDVASLVEDWVDGTYDNEGVMLRCYGGHHIYTRMADYGTQSYRPKLVVNYTSGGGPADLVITTSSLPGGTVDAAYSQTVQATGGTTPYSWSVVSGSLPAGLSLGSSTGTISGTPATANTYNFTVRVTDSQGTPDTDDQALSIVISAGGASATYEFAASDGQASTTSTSYQTKATLTFTPTVADDWLIFGFAEYHGTSTSYSTLVRMNVDASTEAEISRETNDTTDWVPFFTVKEVSLSAAQHTVTLDYRSENSGNTAYIRSARIVAVRKASLSWETAELESETAINTSSPSDQVSLNWTPPTAEDYLLIYTAEVDAGTANSVTLQAKVNGSSWDDGLIEAKDGSDRITFASSAILSADTSQQTIAIATAREGTNTFYIRRARLFAIRLDGRFADYVSASSDSEVTTTSTTFGNKLTSTWSTGTQGDWLLLATARPGENNNRRSVEVRSQLNNSITLGQQLQEPNDATDYLSFVAMDVEARGSGSATVDIDYRSENSSYTARIRAARFVGLPLE